MWDWYGKYKGYNITGILQESNPKFIPNRGMKIKNKLLKKRYSKRLKDVPEQKHHIRWRHVESKKRNKRR